MKFTYSTQIAENLDIYDTLFDNNQNFVRYNYATSKDQFDFNQFNINNSVKELLCLPFGRSLSRP
jgi:hypothetical protein